jgi:hypothetical protein
VIPIEESLIYIRPLYLRAAGGSIPEMKRVIVGYQNQIVMEETLEAGLERLFPDSARGAKPATPVETARPDAPEPTGEKVPAEVLTLAEQARLHYQRALQAQREGNWALYGEEIRKLGEVLEKIRR